MLRHRAPPLRRGVLFAQIGVPHGRIVPDRLRLAAGDDAAVDQHAQPIGKRKYRLHVVLDQEDRHAPFEVAQEMHHARRTRRDPCRPWARRAAEAADRWRAPWRFQAGVVRRGSSLSTRVPARSRKPTRSSAANAGARNASSRRASRQNRNEWPRCACTASATLSSAVKSRNSEVIWNERASPNWLRR